MIKKYIATSFCVLAYIHLLPLLLVMRPNSAGWDFFGLILALPYIPSGFVAMLLVPGGLHSSGGSGFKTAQLFISDILYVGIVWSVFYIRQRNKRQDKLSD